MDEQSGEITVASDLSKLMKEKLEVLDVQVHYIKHVTSNISNFQLKVSAIDAGTPVKSSVKTMKLRIKDVNNHSPQFDEVCCQMATL